LKPLYDNFGMALLNAEIVINQQHASPQLTLPQTFFCLAGALRSRPVKSEVHMMRRRMAPSQRSYRLMSACALLVAALGLFSAPVAAAAQASKTTIDVQGNRRVDAETVRS